jgi:glycosyltransferase involved in cell wall biosynthesis
MNPSLTVVIPTFNRVKRIEKTLESLINQSLDKELFEIVVIDDGSDDGAAQMFGDICKQVKNHIRYYWQEKKSTGSARNMGIMKAKAPIILLMDDDIIPNRDHLKMHMDLHLKYPEPEIAVIGRVTPGDDGVDLVRWDEPDFLPVERASGGEPIISEQYFATADVSLKKEFLMNAGLFTPDLQFAEDTDLALRLKALGLKLIYCREAVAIHTEPMDTLEKVANDGRKYGRVIAQWYGRIPLYQNEIWSLGTRLNGGWDHFSHHPWGYIKDAIRRWSINKYTIKHIVRFAAAIPITKPPKKILRRLCKEIRAYYIRDEFKKQRTNLYDNRSRA